MMDYQLFPYPRPQLSFTPEDQQRLELCISVTEQSRVCEEIHNREFLRMLTDTLARFHQSAVCVITGSAHDYEFQEAVIQTDVDRLEIYRWHEAGGDRIRIGRISGTLQWHKIVTSIKQFGSQPDDDLPQQDPEYRKYLIGRCVTIYVVNQYDQAWARVFSGCDRLPVHQVYRLIKQLIRHPEISFRTQERK